MMLFFRTEFDLIFDSPILYNSMFDTNLPRKNHFFALGIHSFYNPIVFISIPKKNKQDLLTIHFH